MRDEMGIEAGSISILIIQSRLARIIHCLFDCANRFEELVYSHSTLWRTLATKTTMPYFCRYSRFYYE
jgi:hypothetical protein